MCFHVLACRCRSNALHSHVCPCLPTKLTPCTNHAGVWAHSTSRNVATSQPRNVATSQPRNVATSQGMQKQALMHNRDPTEPRFLATTVLLSLCGGQRPLVQTMFQRVTSHINTAPIGFNAKVAIMAKGWNQEDSVVLNADSTQVRCAWVSLLRPCDRLCCSGGGGLHALRVYVHAYSSTL